MFLGLLKPQEQHRWRIHKKQPPQCPENFKNKILPRAVLRQRESHRHLASLGEKPTEWDFQNHQKKTCSKCFKSTLWCCHQSSRLMTDLFQASDSQLFKLIKTNQKKKTPIIPPSWQERIKCSLPTVDQNKWKTAVRTGIRGKAQSENTFWADWSHVFGAL